MRSTWFVLATLAACGNIDPDIAPSDPRRKLTQEAFAAAKSITLYSVAAERFEGFGIGETGSSGPDDARAALDEGDGVFGSVVIDDGATIDRIRSAFLAGYQRSEIGALCYLPHHVLRLRGDDVDLQIHVCFECYYATVLDSSAARYEPFNDRRGLKEVLDGRLAAAEIPVREAWRPFVLTPTARDYVAQELGNDLVNALEAADSLTLYSIDPSQGWDSRTAASGTGEAVHRRLEEGKGVLGSTVIRREAVRRELLRRTFAAMRPGANAARCFLPRHVLVFTQATRTIAVPICFECDGLYLVADASSELVPIDDLEGLETRLNSILRARGIAIAP